MPDRRGRQPVGGPRYPRTARVNKVIQEIVAEGIEDASQTDDRLELLTVTDVKTDPDLRHATVYYSARHERAEEALEEHRVALQSAIGRQTKMKRTPQLSFRVDAGVDTGWRIEEILRQINDDDQSARTGEGPDGEQGPQASA